MLVLLQGVGVLLLPPVGGGLAGTGEGLLRLLALALGLVDDLPSVALGEEIAWKL